MSSSAAALQLAFSLRASTQCKTVHLLGSWDTYKGQLPLSKDNSVSGGWKGTFRFQGSSLVRGQRYWYYYLIDGYHVSHDPCQESIVEPTTGRRLNILDVPLPVKNIQRARATTGPRIDTSVGNNAAYTTKTVRSSTSGHTRRYSRNTPADIPLGRPVSPEAIRSPVPKKPNAAVYLTSTDITSHATVARLTHQFAKYAINAEQNRYSNCSNFSENSVSDIDSDAGSDVPSLTMSPGSSSCEEFNLPSPTDSSSLNSSPRLSPEVFPPAYTHRSRAGSHSSYEAPPAYVTRSPKSTSSRSPASAASSHAPSSLFSRASSASSRTSHGGSGRRSSGAHSSTSRSSGRNSSASSSCTCERYGVTRKGARLRLDCGGGRCGYSPGVSSGEEDSSIYDSGEDISDYDLRRPSGDVAGLGIRTSSKSAQHKRHGVVMRAPSGKSKNGY